MLRAVGTAPDPPTPSDATSARPPLEQDFVRLILGRRSHRVGFDGRPVPDDVLDAIVQCGLAGPSSKNAQPWRFHVVTDRPIIREIADSVAGAPGADTYVPADPSTGQPRPGWESTVLESAAILRSAPACIFVENLGRFSGGRSRIANAPRQALEGALIAYALECAGIGAAVQNLWLAAEALGCKAAFLGDIGVDEVRIAERLFITGDVFGVFAVGWSQLDPEPKRPLDDNLERVRWFGRRPPDHP